VPIDFAKMAGPDAGKPDVTEGDDSGADDMASDMGADSGGLSEEERIHAKAMGFNDKQAVALSRFIHACIDNENEPYDSGATQGSGEEAPVPAAMAGTAQ
jgi:hypothetical protein